MGIIEDILTNKSTSTASRIPTLETRGEKYVNNKRVPIYELHTGRAYISLREWCRKEGLPYVSVRKDLRHFTWPVVAEKYLEKRRKRQERQIAKARRLPPDARPDLGAGLFDNCHAAIEQLQLEDSPFGRLPRLFKIGMLVVMRNGVQNHKYVHHDPDGRAKLLKLIARLIHKYRLEIENIERKAQAAKRLKVKDYNDAA